MPTLIGVPVTILCDIRRMEIMAIAGLVYLIMFMLSVYAYFKSLEGSSIISEVKSVVSPHDVEFRIEYIHDTFPDAEYTALIYVDKIERNVGAIKLLEMYEQKEKINPDPEFVELFYSDTIQCYKFFKNLLIYCHDGEYGFIYIDSIKSIKRGDYDFEKIFPIINTLANAKIDSELKTCCLEFLENL